jgi:hypothetical protein
MGHPKVRPLIHKHFVDHPNKAIWLQQLVEICYKHNKTEPSHEGIRGAVRHLIMSGVPITIVEPANCWVYKPQAETEVEQNKVDVKPSTEQDKANVETETGTEVPAKQRPAPGAVKVLYELIHTTKQGAMVLEDEDGEIVIVKPIDI